MDCLPLSSKLTHPDFSFSHKHDGADALEYFSDSSSESEDEEENSDRRHASWNFSLSLDESLQLSYISDEIHLEPGNSFS